MYVFIFYIYFFFFWSLSKRIYRIIRFPSILVDDDVQKLNLQFQFFGIALVFFKTFLAKSKTVRWKF